MSDLRSLFSPRGVAVVGASRSGAKLGAVMARSLRSFDGALGLVNSRNPDPGSGLHASVAAASQALGAPLDLAVLCVPAAACASAVEDAAAAGIKAALVCAGGFAESGEAGAAHQAALLEAARRTGVRLLGPNTSGFFSPAQKLTASFVPAAGDVPAGGVAVVAASGGINHALSFLLAEAGLGVSLAVGLGNATDVTAPDVLDHLRGDDATRVVALHVESVADGRRLVESVRALTERVPVVALVVGRNDVAEFAQSHTGALATSWRTTRAALRQAGAILVDDEQQLVDAVVALSHSRLAPAANPGVGIVTAQAGPGLLLMDSLRGHGVAVPGLSDGTVARIGELLPPLTYQRNPVDTGRPSETFGAVLEAVAADPGVDVVATYALTEPDSIDLAATVPAASAASAVPTLVGLGGAPEEVREIRRRLHAAGVAAYGAPTALATGAAALVEDARRQHRARQDAGAGTDGGADGADGGADASSFPMVTRTAWDEDEAKALVGRLGFRTMARRACQSDAEAHAALDAVGGPVAVKLLDAAVLHKTEIGGVRLGVRTHDELDEALAALRAAGADRVLVEAMAPSGVDLIVGARRDPVFGPVVLLGLGGTVAEALQDVSLRVAPLSPAEAATMPDDLAGRALLEGFRGSPTLDRSELAALLSALGALLLDHPHLGDVEINPLRVTADGLVALDAVVTTKES
ncbi:acyl-CoA synthetase (plasmid) [Rhodococcus sp. p52]|uniref:acetate--CoA ligase family protein n=1 Tax=Rhodococcus sp. p52 TaxID=935199 RepID=UPI000519FF74|nr:acetate--CoA ligase family protein [Rhodococcus sp. p52]AOD24877.1 acyl-CoA synthetase [Rhodococcus sp. p52]